MPSIWDRIVAWDDKYTSVEDYYFDRLRQLRIVSPALDGTNAQLLNLDTKSLLAKADLTSADAGAVNAIYSLGVFLQYITKANALGALPKETWRRQGYRAVTTASKTSGLGIAEAAALGTAVEPTYIEVGPTPKEIELVSSYAQRLAVLSQIADAVSVDQNRQTIEKDFFRSLNADLWGDVDVVAGNNFESLDRISSDFGEIADHTLDAGDADIYGVDRDAGASWADANALTAASGTDRDLSVSLVDQLRQNQEPYWDSLDRKVFFAPYGQHVKWSQLEAAKQRFGVSDVAFTVGDGITTSPGERAGFKIASWDAIPVVRDDNIPTAQSAGGAIYLFDQDYVGLAWGRPVEYLESDDPFQVGHTIKGVWYGIGELYCTQFKSQGKLSDLTA